MRQKLHKTFPRLMQVPQKGNLSGANAGLGATVQTGNGGRRIQIVWLLAHFAKKKACLLDSIRKSPLAPAPPAPMPPPRLPPPAGPRWSAPIHRQLHRLHPPPRLAQPPPCTARRLLPPPALTLLLIQTGSGEVHTLSYGATDVLRRGRVSATEEGLSDGRQRPRRLLQNNGTSK
jgi:hypothetical protein